MQVDQERDLLLVDVQSRALINARDVNPCFEGRVEKRLRLLGSPDRLLSARTNK
jgi:hypothetical protein